MKTPILATGALITTLFLSAFAAQPAFATEENAEEITVYSYRTPGLMAPVVEAFEADTGIKVNILNAKGLVERIATEGKNSPADVLLTVDIGRLDAAVQAGITAPYSSDVVNKNVPENLRHENDEWIGLTLRSRVVFASNDRVKENALSYGDLADPSLKGKVCTRDGQHVYSIGLFASQIAHNGDKKTKTWLEGLKENLAYKPQGNDRAQAKAVFEGRCDYAILNTYYVGLMKTNEAKPEQKQWAAAGKVIFPDQNANGSHVNIAGVSLIKNAPNAQNAAKFIDFLASAQGQKLYAERVFEYPVNKEVAPSEVLVGFTPKGTKFDELSFQTIAKSRKRASELVDEIGFNN